MIVLLFLVQPNEYHYSANVRVVVFFIILDFVPLLLSIFLAARANRMAWRKYLSHGWEFAEPDSEAAHTARAKWGIVPSRAD
jgi:hypothetical protein